MRPTDGRHQPEKNEWINQVKDDFCEFFISRAGARGTGPSAAGGAPLTVTLEGFREYYGDVGVCEPYDAVFVPMMEVGRPAKKTEGAAQPDATRAGHGQQPWIVLGAWTPFLKKRTYSVLSDRLSRIGRKLRSV